MRTLLCLFACLVPCLVFAGDQYVETITATSSTRNAQTLPRPFRMQCDAPVYYQTGTSTVTVSSSNGRKIQADDDPIIPLGSSETHVAVIPVSGTANCKILRVLH